jgi:hypothetical protein
MAQIMLQSAAPQLGLTVSFHSTKGPSYPEILKEEVTYCLQDWEALGVREGNRLVSRQANATSSLTLSMGCSRW